MSDRKKIALDVIEFTRDNILQELEKNLGAKVIFHEDDRLTISVAPEHKTKIIVDFKGVKPVFKNITGGALFDVGITPKKAKYIKTLYNQYNALKYSYNLVKRVESDKLNDAVFSQQNSISDYG